MLSWDENKRQKNLARHGIDFKDCEPVFDFPLITREDTSEAYGEQRLQSLGMLYEKVVFMVWIERTSGPHLISVRKASKYEQRYYFENLARIGF